MSRVSTNIPAKSAQQVRQELGQAVQGCDNPEAACAKVAQALRVSRTEIALLRMEKSILRFIYPLQLHDAGAIPLSGSSVAARTAVTRAPLLSNSFARVKHASLFESVKLRENSGEEADPMPIQKIISVPIIATRRPGAGGHSDLR